jgi:hypothetical protein
MRRERTALSTWCAVLSKSSLFGETPPLKVTRGEDRTSIYLREEDK